MSKTWSTNAVGIPYAIEYLNKRGCDVLQVLNPGAYWQTIVYNEPKNIMKYFNNVCEDEINAIKDMIYEIDYAILKLTS